jgi:hypothetical protein
MTYDEINAELNDAVCVDSCIPKGMLTSIIVSIADSVVTPTNLRADTTLIKADSTVNYADQL